MGGPGKRTSARANALIEISRELAQACDQLRFGGKVAYVYNPLVYARDAHEHYLRRYGGRPGVALLLGMNPGPWGMAQTGVPFGEVAAARDWLGISDAVGKPAREHPKRPIQGFQCTRAEVSGARLWGWARDRFGTPDAFFERFFVWNYCPLSFMFDSGANCTPDKLTRDERDALYAVCDRALAAVVAALEPKRVVGIGKFAEERAVPLAGRDRVGCILHPSPASPLANGGWADKAEEQLRAQSLL